MVHRGYGTMSSNFQGPSRNDGLSTTPIHSSSPNINFATNINNNSIINYSSNVQHRKQQTLLNFYSTFTSPSHPSPAPSPSVPKPHNPTTATGVPQGDNSSQLPPMIPQPHSPAPPSNPASNLKPQHINPYRPNRRKQAPMRMPLKRPQDPPPPMPLPTPILAPQPSPLPKSIPPFTNPHRRPNQPQPNPLTTQALAQYTPHSTHSSSQSSTSVSEPNSPASLSVRRTRSRLVYIPERLQYHEPGNPTRPLPPLLLPGLAYLSPAQQQEAISTMQEITSLHSQIQECDSESRRLMEILGDTANLTTPLKQNIPVASTVLEAPMAQILVPSQACSEKSYSAITEDANQSLTVQAQIPVPTYTHNSSLSLSDMSCDTPETSTQDQNDDHTNDHSTDSMTLQSPTRSETSTSTVRKMPPSSDKSTCTINNVHDVNSRSQFLDDFRIKHEGDFLLLLQNPRGIKEFRDNDPDFFPQCRPCGKANVT